MHAQAGRRRACSGLLPFWCMWLHGCRSAAHSGSPPPSHPLGATLLLPTHPAWHRARLDGQNQARAEWEKERAELQAEVARLREQNEELEAKLEKVREQRDGATRELSMLEAQLKWMAGARRH